MPPAERVEQPDVVGAPTIAELATELAAAAGGIDGAAPSAPLEVTGARHVLPSVFDVTGLAAATVGAAGLALAELVAARTGTPAPTVRVDTRAVAVAFVSERALAPIGWTLPAILDPVMGDYEAADGWIRLHTNYAHHRAAALRVLGLGPGAGRDDVAGRVSDVGRRPTLEADVVAAGGAAAAMHTTAGWRDHPHGQATADEPLLRVDRGAVASPPRWPHGDVAATAGRRPRPRPDPGHRRPGLHPGAGCVRCRRAAHRSAGLRRRPRAVARHHHREALRRPRPGQHDGAAPFVTLVGEADVVVHGLRPGAMEGLGLGPDELAAINPGLVTARLDAYGWQGPWATRRGFDSLVQMSTGIAAAGAAAAGVRQPRSAARASPRPRDRLPAGGRRAARPGPPRPDGRAVAHPGLVAGHRRCPPAPAGTGRTGCRPVRARTDRHRAHRDGVGSRSRRAPCPVDRRRLPRRAGTSRPARWDGIRPPSAEARPSIGDLGAKRRRTEPFAPRSSSATIAPRSGSIRRRSGAGHRPLGVRSMTGSTPGPQAYGWCVSSR